MPLPNNQPFLSSLVKLSHIASDCMTRIYGTRHDTVLPVWNAAVSIRSSLHRFAKDQLRDMDFGLEGHVGTGEVGVCQALVSTCK